MKTVVDKFHIKTAEQFTETHTPQGVQPATDEFLQILTEEYRKKAKKENIHVFILPKPDESEILTAMLLDSPVSFQWIRYGDYVMTNSRGYSYVESKSYIENNYIDINPKTKTQ